MSEDKFEAFKKCAVEVLSVDAAQVTKEARFAEDLDADPAGGDDSEPGDGDRDRHQSLPTTRS